MFLNINKNNNYSEIVQSWAWLTNLESQELNWNKVLFCFQALTRGSLNLKRLFSNKTPFCLQQPMIEAHSHAEKLWIWMIIIENVLPLRFRFMFLFKFCFFTILLTKDWRATTNNDSSHSRSVWPFKKLSHEQFVQALSIHVFWNGFEFLLYLEEKICTIFSNSQDDLWPEK